MQKFLRNDVADLLKNGLDSNAYGRVEQLYVDQNLSLCYEFVEQSCLHILNNLSAMDKQRECPEECKEAIPTLMFAAARFADLPELRELRSLFSERYGNCLEPYVNKEFVKNLKAETPTEEIKLLMLLEIKLEYDIEWDNKPFEQKLYKSPPFVQESSQYKPQHQIGLETKTNQEPSKKPSEAAKKDHTHGNDLPYKSRVEIEKKNENNMPYKSRAEVDKKEEVKLKVNDTHRRGSPYWSSNSSGSSSESTTSQDDSASEDGPSLRSTPPPYFKPDSKRKDDNTLGRNTNSLRSVGPPYIKTDSTKKEIIPEASSNITPKAVPRSMRIRRPLKPVAGSHGHNEVSKPTLNNSIGDHDYDRRDEEENKRDRKPLPGPTRITSLPTESFGGSEAIEERKGLTRAVTCQGDSDLNSRSHVHPKLPDYDDFVARLAAFRAAS